MSTKQLPREVNMPDGPLACPNCGHGESLWSDEPASIMYAVRLEVVDGALDVSYPGTGYEAQDEGTEYVGDIWCRGCGTQLTEAEILAGKVNDEPQPDTLSDTVRRAKDLAYGDSNDDEIEALQEALDEALLALGRQDLRDYESPDAL